VLRHPVRRRVMAAPRDRFIGILPEVGRCNPARKR